MKNKTMSIDEANLIWDACYGDPQGNGFSLYTPEQREQAINARNAQTFQAWNDTDKIDARRAERDGWETATWDGRW
jgi:hypothetical protein